MSICLTHNLLHIDLTRFNKIVIPNNKLQTASVQRSLSRVQQFSYLCVARPYQISVNSIVKHIHTTRINTIIWQFVPFIYQMYKSFRGYQHVTSLPTSAISLLAKAASRLSLLWTKQIRCNSRANMTECWAQYAYVWTLRTIKHSSMVTSLNIARFVFCSNQAQNEQRLWLWLHLNVLRRIQLRSTHLDCSGESLQITHLHIYMRHIKIGLKNIRFNTCVNQTRSM